MAIVNAQHASARPRQAPLWKQSLAFVVGFLLQFDVLVSGSGAGAAATGGYGFRIFDFLSVVLTLLLAIHALSIARLFSLTLFSMMVGVLVLLRLLGAQFFSDPRTLILGAHYLLYLFAGLYVVILLAERQALDKFCWGLVSGLLATLPIFILQDSGYSSALVSSGLLPGYYEVLSLTAGATRRYAGLWGHPNEASHVAAIAAGASAYLYSVHRRYFPLILTACALLAVFYYTESRGGFLVAAGTLVASFFFRPKGGIGFFRLFASLAVMMIAWQIISQLDFVAWRFHEDPGTNGNLSDRVSSILSGLQIVLTYPLGMPMSDFYAIMATYTGGIVSPHDGFIFFAAIFGFLPFIVLIIAFIANLNVRTDADTFFALATLELIFSFLFEQTPGVYPVAFMMCLVICRAYVKLPIGAPLVTPAAGRRLARMPISRPIRTEP